MFSDFYHIGSAIAVFLGLVIIIRKDKTLSNYILAIWLILMGVNIFLFHRLIDHQEHLEFYTFINYLLLTIQIPIPLIYVNSFLFDNNKKTALSSLYLIGIPIAIVAIIGFAIDLNSFNPDSIFLNNNLFTIFAYLYAILSIPTYLILSLLNIKKLKIISLQQVSDIYENDFVIIKRFIVGILIAYFSFIAIFGLSFFLENVNIYTAFGSSIVTLCLSVIYAGVFGLQKSDIFTVHNYKNKTGSINKSSNPDINYLKEVANKLDACMLEKKPYLRPRLSLSELSEISQIPETQISSAINIIKEQNFYDYINSLRVEEFIKRAKTKDKFDFTLTAIAFECGFNSKSTFFDIFKKQTGKTPAQFIKSL
ncbi:MAG: helix-turn-helix transcriptional regulator [Bacteroidales bacterium]|nr:helix-turn-helix transcriptional regulator [Bacteroidales bacterium]